MTLWCMFPSSTMLKRLQHGALEVQNVSVKSSSNGFFIIIFIFIIII